MICFKKVTSLLLTFSLFIAIFAISASPISAQEYNDIFIEEAGLSYSEYISRCSADSAQTAISLSASNFTKSKGNIKIEENKYGEQGVTLYTYENSTVTWTVDVEEDALYNIQFEYYTVEGKGNKISRKLLIDGKLPFKEAGSLVFKRAFENKNEIKQDELGNDLLPMQQEKSRWDKTLLQDSTKATSEALRFYFSKGTHTISLEALQEPLVLKSVTLIPVENIPTYKEYLSENYVDSAKGVTKIIEGEDAVLKSDSSIIPFADQGSYITYPSDPTKIRLNTIGGKNWNVPGQWVEWDLDIEKSGLYKLTFRAKQNISAGTTSTRELYVDGNIPFKECSSLRFTYSGDWSDVTVTLENGEDALFYLEKGNHKIRLEANLGELANILDMAQDTLLELNGVYRKILMLTGSTPDAYRDYSFDRQIPEIFPILKKEKKNLNVIISALEKDAGQSNESITVLIALRDIVEKIIEKPEKIAKNFSSFSSNLTSMGSVISNLKDRPLLIDRIFVTSKDVEIKGVKTNFFKKMSYNFKKFILSFVTDYNSLGGETGEGKTVKVWIGNGTTAGRDQANVLKQLCQNYFTPDTKINVNLQLISAGALLPSVLTGKSPDVALSLGAGDPVNYACRNAVIDLSKLENFEEVSKRFHASALTAFRYNGGCYALPETHNFAVMFYRKDIIGELGLKIPETWQDVIVMIPELQKHQMHFGLPQAISQDGSAGAALSSFMTFLYQTGGQLYRQEGKTSALDDANTIKTFSAWTQYYTEYELPLQYDFVNRFRTGDVPIGIADYSLYNTLSIFAPELDGLWGIALVPGTEDANGNIDHSVAGGVSGSIMLKGVKDIDSAWKFMSWWTSADTQQQFGNAVEDILGSSARYATANIEAAKKIPWREEEAAILAKQWEYVKGIPEVPGGYVTGRFFDFAFRNVVNNSKEAGTEIITAAANINSELAIKRKEFGLE